jgi:hypothetical protein
MHWIFTHVPLSRQPVEAGRKSTGAIEIKTVEQHVMVLRLGQ